MHTLLALLLFLVIFVVPHQVIAEDGLKDEDQKRQVSVLARDGHLPYQGKRYVGEKTPDSKTSQTSWDTDTTNNDPSVYLLNKRYVGALAKTGDLRFKQREEKRDDVDALIDELLTAEEFRRIRLAALRDELLKEREEEEEELDGEKRSLSSLARTGSFPFRDEKRSIASMARMGYLRSPSGFSDDYDKRGVSSLARNGELPALGKRGGISSIMRNGYQFQKRSFDSDLDSFLVDEYDVDDKRNVASLARAYNLPSMGKRNIASFARNGWLQDFGGNSKKSIFDGWDEDLGESKRSLQSLVRNRDLPLVEGKRYLGAFVASNRLPYYRQNFDDSKRTIGSMARNWNLPMEYGSRYGKRYWLDDDINNEELVKRYVSSLLKQGPLPVAAENSDTSGNDNQSYDQQTVEEAADNIEEEKRHLASLLAHKSFAMRKKKSITPEDQFGDQLPTASSTSSASRSDENKMNNEIQQHHRQKRDAFAEFAAASDEYPMPVLQNTEGAEYEDSNARSNVDEEPARKKRYFAVRGGGKIPGGRLPHVGRSRSNNPNSGRRRH